MNPKILLISSAKIISTAEKKRIVPPFSLMYLAAVLEENNFKDVKILDVALEGYETEEDYKKDLIIFGLKDEEIKRRITKEKPDIVGVSMSLSTNSSCSHKICRLVKEVNRDIKVVVGGVHATALAKEVIKDDNIDIVITGEGEYSFLEVVKNPNGYEGIVKGKEVDINELPMPSRHLVNIEKYLQINTGHYYLPTEKRSISILTSRGCNFNCTYCASTKFWGKWRGRSADKVIEEIKFLIDRYNINEIEFEDDNMIFDRKRAIEIFTEIKKLNISFLFPNGIIINAVDRELLKLMKEAGCYSVTYGVEVGNKEVLHKIIKKPVIFEKIKEKIDETKKQGIIANIFLMVGLPGETKQNIKETFEFAKYLNPDNVFLSIYNPLPGSSLYDLCVENNYLDKKYSFENCLYRKANISTEEFSSNWLESYAKKEYKKLDGYLKFQKLIQSKNKIVKQKEDLPQLPQNASSEVELKLKAQKSKLNLFNKKYSHPYFFLIFILLFIYKQNIYQLSFSKILMPLITSLILVFLIFIFLKKIITDETKATIITSFFVLLFFNYGRIFETIRRPPPVEPIFIKVFFLVVIFLILILTYLFFIKNGWKKKNKMIFISCFFIMTVLAVLFQNKLSSLIKLDFIRAIQVALVYQNNALLIAIFIVFILISFWIIKSKAKFDSLNHYLNVLSIVLIIMVLVQIGAYFVFNPGISQNIDNLLPTSFNKDLIQRKSSEFPDIYYIILDGYANEKTLLDVFDYDNSDFIGSLEAKGFYVANQSRSNYLTTFLSLPSSLNFNYLNFLENDPGKESLDRSIPYQMLEFNEVAKSLKLIGYQYVFFTSWVDITRDSKFADTVYNALKVSEFSSIFLRSTPLRAFAPNDAYLTTVHTLSKLKEVPKISKKPKFVFAHIVSPHPPFVFDRDGGEKVNIAYDPRGCQWEDKGSYIDQIFYLNEKVLEVVNTLINNSNQPPIIIIQADHGTESVYGWMKNPTKARFDERSYILNAYYLPGGGKDLLYNTITPVNTFRIIFNYYFNQNYTLLDDNVYFSNYEITPYKFELMFNNGKYVIPNWEGNTVNISQNNNINNKIILGTNLFMH